MDIMSTQVDGTPPLQYGLRFRDGSVMHPWNGRTQLQRAVEKLAELRVTYPNDGPFLRIVVRRGPDDAWAAIDE